MTLSKFLFFALAAVFVAACFPSMAQSAAQSVNGAWQVTLRHRSFGEMRLHLDWKVESDSTFQALSHRKGVRNLVGGFKATAGKIFKSKSNAMLRTGALTRLENGRYRMEGADMVFTGVLHTPMSSMDIKGRISGDSIRAGVFQAGTDRVLGSVDGFRTTTSYRIDDYVAITHSLMEVFGENIYDARALQSKEWKEFEAKMRRFSNKAQDDLELIAAFHNYSKDLKFSHKGFYRVESIKGRMRLPFAPRPNQITLEEQTPETVVLRVKSFSCTAAEMDSAMQMVLQKGYKNLIVDLRGNGGGSLEGGITLAGYLTNEETPTGVYLTQRWFRENPAPPTAQQLETMPAFAKADVNSFAQELDDQGFVVLKARPGKQRFDGQLFVLTDRGSASACEPLTWNLKHTGRATVVGEPTAGQMLSADSYPVRSGFVAIIPNADYYTPTGERLDLVGVKPNIEVKSAQALQYVLDQLAKK